MGLNCTVFSSGGKQSLVIYGEDATSMFYATAKLHNATPDVAADRTVFWESKDILYELAYVGDVPRLTLTLKG